jgi:hypothetical protein
MINKRFFRKSCRLWDNTERYCRRGQATDDNMAHGHCFFLSCKANARVKLTKTGHGPHSPTLVFICVVRLLFVLLCALIVCKCVLPPGDNPIAVNKYHIISYIISYIICVFVRVLYCVCVLGNMIWYDIWYDMIWYDMIWYDMIWYGMIWYIY